MEKAGIDDSCLLRESIYLRIINELKGKGATTDAPVGFLTKPAKNTNLNKPLEGLGIVEN